MKRVLSRILFAALFSSLSASAFATIIFWTGVLPTGWRGGAIPTTGDDIFIGSAVNNRIDLPGSITLNSVIFAPDGDTFYIDSGSPVILSLTGGLISGDAEFGRLVLQPNVAVGISGSEVFDAGNNGIVVYSKITGSGSPIFLATGSNGAGAFLFVNTGASNDYTGNTVIGDGTFFPTISFWNGSPFGTGTVTFLNGGNLISHNTQTLANTLILNSAGSTNALLLRNWDAPLTMSGSVTLANNTILQANSAFTHLASPDNSGSFVTPGPLTRFPTVFTGNIGDSGGARSLTVNGPGLVILKPTAGSNTFSGGMTVNGSVIFGNNGGLPDTSTNKILINTQGYVGFADVTPGNFLTQLVTNNVINRTTSNGAIGVDTLPGNGTITFSDDINLSNTGTGATSFSQSSIRIGTATSAILTGNITPQGPNFLFGSGGGSLYVQSALSNTTASGTVARSLIMNNGSQVPLKLYLQGVNSYSNGTTANSGLIIFDGASAIPAAGSLVANGLSTNVGGSYIGYTDFAGINGGSVMGSDPTAFLAQFNKPGTWGIIGFDTHLSSPTATINGVNLTGFNDGVFLGTATSAVLTGNVTPSTLTNGNNAAGTLRFTAANAGTLIVSSNITGGGVMIGSPSGNNAFSSGTVLLNGANFYGGGTTINPTGITVVVGSNIALGTGTVSIAPSTGSVAMFGLQVTAPSQTLTNSIVFQTPNYVTNGPAQMALTGSADFELAGAISSGPVGGMGQTPATISMYNAAPINVTLSGDNSGYFGGINVINGTLFLGHNNAAGMGTLNLGSAAATIEFGGAATAPVLHGINGDAGTLTLPGGTMLTFDLSNDNNDSEFGGVISQNLGAASLTVTSTNPDGETLYLYGHNQYSGGTTISGYGALGLGFSDSAGSGTVTLNTTDGGLILNTGVTFTNDLVFNSGGLAGLGSFAPSSISGTGQTPGRITIGAGQTILPGIPGDREAIVGTLIILSDVTFTNGGDFEALIHDPTSVDGTSLLFVNGNLDLTSLSTTFLIGVHTVDPSNEEGFSTNIAWGQAYTNIPIVETAGTISGFNASNFVFDLSEFQGGIALASDFSITADSQHLYLNFVAIPEPSTWALLVTGAGMLGLAAWRRRRA